MFTLYTAKQYDTHRVFGASEDTSFMSAANWDRFDNLSLADLMAKGITQIPDGGSLINVLGLDGGIASVTIDNAPRVFKVEVAQFTKSGKLNIMAVLSRK